MDGVHFVKHAYNWLVVVICVYSTEYYNAEVFAVFHSYFLSINLQHIYIAFQNHVDMIIRLLDIGQF